MARKSRRVRKGGGGDSKVAPRDVEMFTCKQDGCGLSAPAKEMFNLSCDPENTTREHLLERIRCRACAEALAEKRGKRLLEPGCGSYPLVHTLKKLEDLRSVHSRHEDLRRWVEENKTQKSDEARLMREERERRQARREHEEMIRHYAKSLAEAENFGSTGRLALPQPYLALCEDQATKERFHAHVCGLPIGCCRHDRPVQRYLTVLGEVIGICDQAARVFTDVFRQNGGKDDRYRRLLSTRDLAMAHKFAERWCGRNTDDE